MALEDKHPDVLQNIEAIIVTVDREEGRRLKDLNAIRALEALITHYRKLVIRAEPPEPDLEGVEQDIFEGVVKVLETRKNVSSDEDKEATPSRKRFSRALKEPSQEEIFVACLRKLHKSANRWNKNYGERGYLDFIGKMM